MINRYRSVKLHTVLFRPGYASSVLCSSYACFHVMSPLVLCFMSDSRQATIVAVLLLLRDGVFV